MSLFTEILKFLGLGFNTYVVKLDIGDGYKKRRCSETDQFIKFRDRGTQYIVLKTVPPKIDSSGNKFWFMMESDVHTYNPNDGKVLNEKMEEEFKKRLLKNEIQQFEELLKDAKKEVIKERTREIYDSLVVSKEATDDLTDGSDNSKNETDSFELEIEMPVIKIGKTLERRIEDLTPHDTINEVMSMILDGTILSSLLTPPKLDMKTILGVLIVGVALGWILIILYAVAFPDQWAAFVGKPVPSVSYIQQTVVEIKSLIRSWL